MLKLSARRSVDANRHLVRVFSIAVFVHLHLSHRVIAKVRLDSCYHIASSVLLSDPDECNGQHTGNA